MRFDLESCLIRERRPGLPPRAGTARCASIAKPFCLALLAALLVLPALAQSPQNPGFEDDLAEWIPKFDYNMSSVVPDAARSGKLGLRVTDESASSGSGLQSMPLEVLPGQEYEAVFWARTVSGSGGLRVALCFFDDHQVRLQKQPPFAAVQNCPEWTSFRVKGIAPEGAVACYIQISSVPLETGVFDLDDFAFAPVP